MFRLIERILLTSFVIFALSVMGIVVSYQPVAAIVPFKNSPSDLPLSPTDQSGVLLPDAVRIDTRLLVN